MSVLYIKEEGRERTHMEHTYTHTFIHRANLRIRWDSTTKRSTASFDSTQPSTQPISPDRLRSLISYCTIVPLDLGIALLVIKIKNLYILFKTIFIHIHQGPPVLITNSASVRPYLHLVHKTESVSPSSYISLFQLSSDPDGTFPPPFGL